MGEANAANLIIIRLDLGDLKTIDEFVTTFNAEVLRGATPVDALAASGLTDQDFPLVSAGRNWIAAMQAECRRAITDGRAA